MGRGKGQQEDWPKRRDILPWLWQRPWKMLRGKKSPWRYMKAAHYYYFAEVFLPLHKPWGPFTFPECPRRQNLTLKWEELNISGGLQFSEGGGLYAERPHNTCHVVPSSVNSSFPGISWQFRSIAYVPTHRVSGFDFKASSHWTTVLIKDSGWVSL